MDAIQPLELRSRIYLRRADFPSLPSYLGPWGMAKTIDRLRNMGKADAALFAFREDVLRYIDIGLSVFKDQSVSRDAGEAHFMIAFALDAFSDESFEDKRDILAALLPYYGDGEDFLPRERASLLYAIILGHSHIDHPWRGKPFAKTLLGIMEEGEVPLPYEIYRGLVSFFRIVLDRPDAEKVINLGCISLEKDGQTKQADALREDGLRATFKHDPVEDTPAFQETYDEVMEEAIRRYLEGSEPRLVFTLWEYMEEGFARKGIAWRNPKKMNPDVRFD